MTKGIESNIIKLNLIKISKWFMLFMPIVILFYESNGLEMRQIMLLQGIYSISIAVLEIPSGYLADVLGRKTTLVLGAVFGFLGFLTYSITGGFWGFLIAEILLGIGQSLVSGADSAMLYDSLKSMGKEKEYLKFEGNITSIGNAAEAIAGLIGGLLLAGISLRLPYVFQSVIAFAAIPVSMSLIEPARADIKSKLKFSDIIGIARFSLFDNKILRRNIYFSALIGTATLTMAWFTQPVFIFLGLPTRAFGFLWPALNITVAVFALLAYKIEGIIGEKTGIVLIAVLIPVGYILIGIKITFFSLLVIFLFNIVRGYATPILKSYINRITESNVRATVLSVRNFIIRINFFIIAPFLGWYTDFYSLEQAFLIAGMIFLVLSLTTLFFFLKSYIKKKKL